MFGSAERPIARHSDHEGLIVAIGPVKPIEGLQLDRSSGRIRGRLDRVPSAPRAEGAGDAEGLLQSTRGASRNRNRDATSVSERELRKWHLEPVKGDQLLI